MDRLDPGMTGDLKAAGFAVGNDGFRPPAADRLDELSSDFRGQLGVLPFVPEGTGQPAAAFLDRVIGVMEEPPGDIWE